MQPSPIPLAAAREEPEFTHPCIRCGRPGVAAQKGLCDDCNPLELAQPSATQVHGIAALGIIVFVVILAVLARFALAETGPFVGYVAGVAPADGGLAVTLVVANQGSNDAATTCRLAEASGRLVGPRQVVQTPVVPAGQELRFESFVSRFGIQPVALVVECQSP
ncbi:MAG TPA: hypothetical protein VK831_05045 [Candidatus Deferrimicrobiaceae bacterium]|nr:hypothetical protein [Candidatus Deferrimicrobiaceae bacterium]